ncbi:MAG: cupin domain-containing protein [Devosiaceae bacterium]|nr:cupin domain-containing protein [Devosiaceae bacterium]
MTIRNFLNAEVKSLNNSHGGKGPFDLIEIWKKSDFKSNIDFFDRVVIPPDSSIGIHKHANNEEMYVVLAGRGKMTINGKTIAVKKGDMILNRPFGEHGLVNDGEEDMDILIIQISC